MQAYFKLNRENRIFTQSSIGARALGVLLMMAPAVSLAAFWLLPESIRGPADCRPDPGDPVCGGRFQRFYRGL